MKRKVAKIKALKLAINREVWKRDEALSQHGKDNEVLFKDLENLYHKVRGYFESLAARKAIRLYKRLDEAQKAADEVCK
jgi:hypothetical protein